MMRFSLCVYGSIVLLFGSFVDADLRMASQPKTGYKVRDQGQVKWNFAQFDKMHYRYMEPSTFNYKGLAAQKARNYDNFLRSNIDNEQDNRNFNDEEGKDHLPFRTMETTVFGEYGSGLTNKNGILQPDPQSLAKIVRPGDSVSVPLRWNNPHASEMEVNVWIFEHADKRPVVVPIRKPSCSGEGYQDNMISFTVPADFKSLGAKIPGFKGCNEDSKPMCTLQIYSHSVESRTYAIGFPIVIPGHDASLKANAVSGINDASVDPWLDLSGLRDLCLPATDPSATISKAVPRWARLVSDVYNHAYQNSDFSPYSGQQQESISKNMQASAVNKMEVGNRGELGKSILPTETNKRLAYLRGLENKIYRNYEALANTIIRYHGNQMATSGTIGVQQLARCFRCLEVGSTRTNRQQTNTYIPSFQLSTALIPAAKRRVPAKYAGLITESGLVQIYVAAMKDMLPFFYQSRELGIMYQPAKVKSLSSTMIDATKFKKRNANGQADNGVYAATAAKMEQVAALGCPRECLTTTKPAFVQIDRQERAARRRRRSAKSTRRRTKSVATTSTTTTTTTSTTTTTTTTTTKKCEWTKHAGKYSNGYVRGYTRRMLFADAKLACVKLGAQCAALTCYRDRYQRQICQIRAGTQMLPSRRAEETYTFSLSCRLGLPEGSLEAPIIKGVLATNVRGICAPCVKLFGKGGVHPMSNPALTPLDKSIINDGKPVESNVGGRLANNPN